MCAKFDIFRNLTIDKLLPIPVYYQIQNLIHELIVSGKLKEGEKLPVETELCKIFGVSRMTIKQALDKLVASGELIRLKGKGTFVKSSNVIIELSKLHSFSEDMQSRGFRIRNEVLENTIIKRNNRLSNKLHISLKEKVFKFTRLRYVNSQPYALETSYIPLMLCPGIHREKDLSAISLFYLFEKKYKHKISYAEQTLAPIISDKKISEIMHIPINTPLVQMEGITFLNNDIPIEYIIGYYRGDRYKFKLKLKR